jgi:hemerythrin-like metal-binding protein
MALIEWTNDLVVDEGPIDDQHRQLVDIINKFDEANSRGKGSRVMGTILNELMGYTQEHFSFEEKLLKDADFPNLSQHQSQHRQLIQKLERFQFEFNSGKRVTIEIKEFLKYWLTSHILKDDMDYSTTLELGASTQATSTTEEISS